MEVTSVKIHRTFNDPEKLIVAVASVLIDNMLAIHNVRVLNNDGKMFIAMPNKKLEDGTFKDVCHPINSEGRELLEDAVISAYTEYCENEEANN